MPGMPICTNQRNTLRWKLVEGGIRPTDLQFAVENDPIVMRGSVVDVSINNGRILVHFCRSLWRTDVFKGRPVGEKDKLGKFVVKFLCPIPEPGQRYSVDAEVYFNGSQPVLAITSFTHQCEIPEETSFVLNDVHPADFTTPLPEETVERVTSDTDLYGEPLLQTA